MTEESPTMGKVIQVMACMSEGDSEIYLLDDKGKIWRETSKSERVRYGHYWTAPGQRPAEDAIRYDEYKKWTPISLATEWNLTRRGAEHHTKNNKFTRLEKEEIIQ